MSIKKILKSKKITYFLYALLILIAISEITYFSYRYISSKILIEKKQEKIKKTKEDIKILSKMVNNTSKITSSDVSNARNRFVKPEIEARIGAYIYNADIVSKGKDKKNTFYKVKLEYSAKNEVGLRKLIALIMLNKDIYSLESINKENFIVVLKEKNTKEK